MHSPAPQAYLHLVPTPTPNIHQGIDLYAEGQQRIIAAAELHASLMDDEPAPHQQPVPSFLCGVIVQGSKSPQYPFMGPVLVSDCIASPERCGGTGQAARHRLRRFLLVDGAQSLHKEAQPRDAQRECPPRRGSEPAAEMLGSDLLGAAHAFRVCGQ